jgi:hypothetical protein
VAVEPEEEVMSDTKWELVASENATDKHGYNTKHPNARTHRLKVPGGWLYRVTAKTGVCMSFVPEEKGA